MDALDSWLTFVDPSKGTKLTPKDVLVVREYISVFLKDSPGLLLDKEIVFSIELVLETALISRAPYRLAPNEQVELKT